MSLFNTLLDTLLEECLQDYSNTWWPNMPYGKMKAFKAIKSFKKPQKKELVFHLVSEYNRVAFIVSQKTEFLHSDLDITRKELYSTLLKALLRSDLGFEAAEISRLFEAFRTSSESQLMKFGKWPLVNAAKQIVSRVKKKGLEEDMKVFLKQLKEWPEMQLQRSYEGEFINKTRAIIDKLLLADEMEGGTTLPYSLPQDRLADKINPEIAALKAEERDLWYQLFHILSKTKGAKPAKAFLETTSGLIDQIGPDAYKERVYDWIAFFCKLDAIPTVRSQNNYEWTNYEFLEKTSHVFLKGLMWTLSQFNDSTTLIAVAKLTDKAFQKIPTVGPRAAGVGNAAIYTLGSGEGLEGISQLSRLKLRIKQNNTQKLIEGYIEAASEKMGISAAEIEELSIPDFGLVNGQKQYAFDDYSLQLRIEDLGKVSLSWIKPDGKSQKSVPSFVKESDIHTQTLKEAKDTVKQIKKFMGPQRDRIDRSYLHDRTWNYENFCKYYIDHGLVGWIAQKLIWEFEKDGSYVAAYWSAGQWKDIQDTTLDWVIDASAIRLWHPIYSTTEETLLWRNKLESLGIKQPMKQAYREIYLLTDAEINTKTYSNRMAAHLLKQHQFNVLAAIRGWKYSLLGCYDDGRDGEIARIPLKEHKLHAQFWINEVYADDEFNEAGIWNYVSTDQVRFLDEEENVKDLIDIPTLVFSEVMRDVDLFVGVGSVGNDPEWRDNGGLAQFQTYWTTYSFGDLTEVAKTRKVILENLLPRLKISKQASIEGKFLRVEGQIRTYKIHIGSTNILMEPNDQYLCIVPARGKDRKTENIFLPFEGDRGLSVVLSKAFMLAEDTKITDSTIVSQIQR